MPLIGGDSIAESPEERSPRKLCDRCRSISGVAPQEFLKNATVFTNPSSRTIFGFQPRCYFAAALAALGEFSWLEFAIEGEPIAITINRIYREGGGVGAKLLHVQSARTDAESFVWILGETSAQITTRSADWIDVRLTCSNVCDALAKVGYMAGCEDTAFW